MRRYRRARVYAALLGLAAIAGLAPAAFNLVVDPFEMNDWVRLDLEKAKISEKAHYPLWKLLHYPDDGASLVVLGDSRARALRDKYWRELGQTGAYNFAYGGANIPEVFATFEHVKREPRLQTLVLGVQLRSFDPDHKAGLNRVPEAIALSQDPLSYYTSWFVAKIGWRNLVARHPELQSFVDAITPRMLNPAKAADIDAPIMCQGCAFPAAREGVLLTAAPGRVNRGLGRGLGVWRDYYQVTAPERTLPPKFQRQVTKNARSDWKSFEFSGALWSQIVKIAEWCDQNDVELIFVIPPTIVEMQKTISDYGHAPFNHELRNRLAQLAPVLDFDFDNPVTQSLDHFSDAYHFGPKIARQIVGEIVQLSASDPRTVAIARAKRQALICPLSPEETTRTETDGFVTMREGAGCRLWRTSDDQ